MVRFMIAVITISVVFLAVTTAYPRWWCYEGSYCSDVEKLHEFYEREMERYRRNTL